MRRLGSLFLLLLIAEGGCSGLYLWKQKSFTRAPQIAYRQSLVDEEDFRLGPAANTFVLHPLWGFSYNPASPGINRFGFDTPYAFTLGETGYRLEGDYSKSPFIVGIFGGSVAHGAAKLAGRYLESVLRQRLHDRTPVVINFAIGGHSLPQGLHIFLYVKEMLHAAVFLDGINELWNASDNNSVGTPPEYAKAAHFLFRAQTAELSPENLIRSARAMASRLWLGTATRWSLLPVLRQSLLVHSLWRSGEFLFKRAIHNAMGEILASTPKRDFFPVSNGEMLTFAASRWRRHHETIDLLAKERGIRVLHFLQPNPFIGAKPMSDDERERSGKYAALQRFILPGFPLLERAVEDLRLASVDAESLATLFDDEKKEVWTDGLHFNELGARIVMDRAAARLLTPHSTLSRP